MALRGVVTSIGSEGTRVTFPERENKVSSQLPTAAGVDVQLGDRVVVAFFDCSMQDGVIIAKY